METQILRGGLVPPVACVRTSREAMLYVDMLTSTFHGLFKTCATFGDPFCAKYRTRYERQQTEPPLPARAMFLCGRGALDLLQLVPDPHGG